jgi:rhodanese-related sulfurtransferase
LDRAGETPKLNKMRRLLYAVPCLAFLLFAADPWEVKDVIEPAQLAARLPLKAEGPLVIHTGFAVLYRANHIPGSVYAGPGSQEAGINDLKKAVEGQPKDREIILYCGCCPFDRCPNLRPAFATLREMGFTNIHTVHIAENLRTDWTEKGYPVEQ